LKKYIEDTDILSDPKSMEKLAEASPKLAGEIEKAFEEVEFNTDFEDAYDNKGHLEAFNDDIFIFDDTVTSRPTWRQSEIDAMKDLPGYKIQKSFINGEEVKYGTKGSVRPDYFKDGSSVDIKNYDVQSKKGRNNLIKNVEKQYYERINSLPSGTNQSVIIDIRGQKITDADLDDLYYNIIKRTNGGVTVRFKLNRR